MAGDGWAGCSWVREPVFWERGATGQLYWRTRPMSDFWRHTGGVVGADDGDAFLAPREGDFHVTMRLTTEFASPYDQCGLMVRIDERNWLKAGIERDDGTWFSVVETREDSDWSKQAVNHESVDFTVWRSGDTLRVGLVRGDALHLVRELTFDGPVAVGPYSCAPKGPGFPVRVTSRIGSDGTWLLEATAGEFAE